MPHPYRSYPSPSACEAKAIAMSYQNSNYVAKYTEMKDNMSDNDVLHSFPLINTSKLRGKVLKKELTYEALT